MRKLLSIIVTLTISSTAFAFGSDPLCASVQSLESGNRGLEILIKRKGSNYSQIVTTKRGSDLVVFSTAISLNKEVCLYDYEGSGSLGDPMTFSTVSMSNN